MQPEYLVWLPDSVSDAMFASASIMEPLETGGILVGYWATERQAVITQTIAAGPQAAHGKNSFSPDHEYQLRELFKIYDSTDGVETYLGDWHSHPGQKWPRLSGKDRSTLKRIVDTSEARTPTALMMIVGGNGFNWKPRIWAGQLTSWLGLWDGLIVVECGLKSYRQALVFEDRNGWSNSNDWN